MIANNLTTAWCKELYQALIESFNLEGFELLCSDLNISIEELNGQTLISKIVGLIEYMEAHHRLNELIDACQQLHSRASWDDIRYILPQATPIIPLAERFSMEIQPAILSGAGTCEVIINNKGIQRTSYTITGSDPFGTLNLADGYERQKVVSPGYTAKVNLRVAPKKRPFIGRSQSHPFTIQVSTSTRHQQSAAGQIIVKPILPLWAATLLSLLSTLLLLGLH